MAYDFSKKINLPAQFNANNNFANVDNGTNTENSNSTDKKTDKKMKYRRNKKMLKVQRHLLKANSTR